MIGRQEPFYQTHWQNILFKDINITLTNKLPTSDFYSAFYKFLFKRYSKYEELPKNWLLQKKDSAENIKFFLKKQDLILSYGCGLGYVEHLLNKENFNLNVFDFSSISTEWLINRNKNINRLNKLTGKYDCIYLQQVLYSMEYEDCVELIKKLGDNLNNTGKIILINTSSNPIQNGFTFKNIFYYIKNIIRPLYHFLIRNKNNNDLSTKQFWGWNRNNLCYISMALDSKMKIIKIFAPINRSNESYILLGKNT